MKKGITSIVFLAVAITAMCIGKADLHASCNEQHELRSCMQDQTLSYSGACRMCACKSYRNSDPRYNDCVCGHNLAWH